MTEETSIQHIKAHVFKKLAQELLAARTSAGLTQAQLAERLGTKTSSIARLEADILRGAVSMRRFADYASACGMAPMSFMLDEMLPLIWAELFLAENPDIPLTRANLLAWNAARIRQGTNVILKPETWQVDFE